ncbi:rhodanese-like domain-containing protein [Candidatus Kapabacteria bacterium]|nr:rhodanese-like domain-containing protein [Candidatus Kapabacteria bacterium]
MLKLSLIFIILLLSTACAQNDPNKEITNQELSDLLSSKKGIVLVDVAEPDEHSEARLEGAVNVPIMGLKDNFEKEFPNINKDDEIVLYCYSGMRSAIGVEKLNELGYTNVKSLVGGISKWKKEGLPVKSTE